MDDDLSWIHRRMVELSFDDLGKDVQVERIAPKAIQAPPAPIMKIPSEILVQILHILTTIPEGLKSPPRILAQASLVCKRWRDVIILTGSLWSTIHLPRNVRDLGPRFLPFLEMQLHRSGSSALTLIQGKENSPIPIGPRVTPSMTPLVTYLKPHYARFVAIDLTLGPDTEAIVAFFDPNLCMPVLKHLQLCLKSRSLQMGERILRSMPLTLRSCNAPNLTDVTLILHDNQFNVTLPWSQLIALKYLAGPLWTTARDFIDPFNLVHNLIRAEQLEFNVKAGRDQPISNHPSILPSLRSLKLPANPNPAYQDFLQRLSVPSLQELAIWTSQRPSFQPLCETLQHFQSATLTILVLSLYDDSGHSSEPLIKILRTLEHIEKFRCTIDDDMNGFMESIMRALADPGGDSESVGSGEILLPRLKHLHLKGLTMPLYEDLDALQILVRERMSSIDVATHLRRPLRTIDLSAKLYEAYGSETRTVKPPRYNDSTSRLALTLTGGIKPGLEPELEGLFA